jgi:fatty-acyl-CoA synthase
MAALELAAPFDPTAFADFLAAQPDLGTKWAPRFVRLAPRLPLTATNKIDKRVLRGEHWECADPVWWRPEREPHYRRLTEDDRTELRRCFQQSGRANLLRL